MVTNVPFYSFKDIELEAQRAVCAPCVLIVLAIAFINIHTPTVLFAVFAIYGFSGYAVYLWCARPRASKPV